MKTPPAQHRSWAARAALAAARNDQPAMDVLTGQVSEHEGGFSALILALAYELSTFYVEAGLVDNLEQYAEDVTALALTEDGAQ